VFFFFVRLASSCELVLLRGSSRDFVKPNKGRPRLPLEGGDAGQNERGVTVKHRGRARTDGRTAGSSDPGT